MSGAALLTAGGAAAACAATPRGGTPRVASASRLLPKPVTRAQGRAPSAVRSPGPRESKFQTSALGRQAVFAAAEKAELDLPMPKEKLITKVEIPNFIQRDDFIDQLYRWTINAGEENGGKRFGMSFKADPVYVADGHGEGIDILWGWTTSFVKAGDITCVLFCGFDDDIAKKYRWIGRNMETGMPQTEGDYEEILGKHFEMWKLGTDPVDEATKSSIKMFCVELADAITKYYSFGSCWAEDI